jgi:hypothetical protein
MADPVNPTDPNTPVAATPTADDLAAWQQYNEFTAQAATNIGQVNGVTLIAQQAFNAMNDGLKKLGISFTTLDAMTTTQAAGFGALSTAILGSKQAFMDLAGADTTRLLTFTGQVKELQEAFQRSPAFKLAKKELDDVVNAAAKLTDKALGTRMIEAAQEKFRQATQVISDSAMAMLTGADNSLRLQNAMVQLTQQAGNAKDLFQGIPGLMDGVGDGFENIGIATKFYTEALEKGSAALGGNQELAARYMAEITKMPGGFKALIAPLKVGSDETDLLTASIQYAVGAGRKQEEVFQDMSKAMAEYSISGGDALRFSARISEVANDVGAQFKDVQSALHGAIDEFKNYVNSGADAQAMTQGMADAMKKYVGELTAVGVPAQNAVEMFKNYSSQMKNMTIGQQAFLSTMGGGPGGLRGALQVQEDLAKGNFDKLRQEVNATIRKVTGGPIITREEGMRSEAAASQYVRQMQVLQQGPLGSLAKNQGDADSLIRALKSGGKLPTPGSGKTPEQTLQDTMTKGQEWQKGSYTELTKVNTNLQAMMLRGGMANLATTQQMFTAAAGRSIPGGTGYGAGVSPVSQENLAATQRTIAVPAQGSQVFKQTADAVAQLPKTFQDAWASFKEAILGGNKDTIQKANDRVAAAFKDQQAVQQNMSAEQRAAYKSVQDAYNTIKPGSTGTTPPTTAPPKTGAPGAPPAFTPPKMQFTPTETYQPAATAVRQAVPQPNTGGAGAGTGGRTPGQTGQGGPGMMPPGQVAPTVVTVNITGVCPHCGQDVHYSPTDQSVSQTAGQTARPRIG